MFRSWTIPVVLAWLTLSVSARAGDDIQAASRVWSDFVSSLRRGDYPHAHRLFSRESRAAMPYADFVSEYGPLSIAREMVLVKPESLSTRLDGEWAEIAFGGVSPGSGRRFTVGVSLVKNGNDWSLVAARNERPERLEAEARNVLRTISIWRGRPDAANLLAELRRTHADNPLLRSYRFEMVGHSFQAISLLEGLRSFQLDGNGVVVVLAQPGENRQWAIQIAAPEEEPEPVTAFHPPHLPELPSPSHSPFEKVMPEMREPPTDGLPPMREMPEPSEPQLPPIMVPLIDGFPTDFMPEPMASLLPDSIG